MTKPADFACKVCEAQPDQEGRIEHGKGCYQVSDEGGGVSYVDLHHSQGVEIAEAIAAAAHERAAGGCSCGYKCGDDEEHARHLERVADGLDH